MMAESDAHKKWVKENTVFVGIRLQKNTDKDIIDYLDGKQNQTEFKKAIRYYIKNYRKRKETEDAEQT